MMTSKINLFINNNLVETTQLKPTSILTTSMVATTQSQQTSILTTTIDEIGSTTISTTIDSSSIAISLNQT
ncbi:unnamed protein product, partial [Rotaria sordida]